MNREAVARNTPQYAYECTVAEVIDGDTIDVCIDVGFDITLRERLRAERLDTHEIHFVSEASSAYERGMAQTEYLRDWIAEARTPDVDGAPFVVVVPEYQRGSYARLVGDLWSRHHDAFWCDAMLAEFGNEIQYVTDA